MEHCPAAREAFGTRVQYGNLCLLVESLVEPTVEILQEGFNMVSTNDVYDIIVFMRFLAPLKVVEGRYIYREGTHSIYNSSAVAMLVRWLKTLPNELRLWIATRLYDLCSFGAHNKQRCCSAGIIRVIVDTLASSQDGDTCFSEEVEGERAWLLDLVRVRLSPRPFVLPDHLISLLEVLGSHSIRAAELKQVIGALRPLESGALVRHLKHDPLSN